jgi:hypothetical protein
MRVAALLTLMIIAMLAASAGQSTAALSEMLMVETTAS